MISELNTAFQTLLSSSLPSVTSWDHISFGILPNEAPKGFTMLMKVDPVSLSLNEYFWGVGILVSGTSKEDLDAQVFELIDNIILTFNKPRQCTGLGRVEIEGSVDVEQPQTYAQQSNVSTTTGFFTSVTFMVKTTS